MAHLTVIRVPPEEASVGTMRPHIGDVFPLIADSTFLGHDKEPPADGSALIHLPHHTVNRRHAVIVRSDGVFRIRDLRSRGRTFVSGKATDCDTCSLLADGDQIEISYYYFVFSTGAPEAGAPTDPA